MAKVAVGKKVPTFCLPVTGGGNWKPADAAGKKVVIYFYPKDMTSGCTLESQNFRDLQPAFRKANTVLLGISRDSIASHEKFQTKQSLPFALVSDPQDVWASAFDVIHEKTLYGRKFVGVVRSTFLFDPAGRLIAQWRGVRVPGHANVVLETIKTASK